MARFVVGLVPGGGGRVLHDHQAYGRLAGWRWRVVRGVLLGGVFATAVVQDAGDEEDEQQDNIAGDQDDEVQGDGVNLQVEFHKTHGAASYLGPDPEEEEMVGKERKGNLGKWEREAEKKSRSDGRRLDSWPEREKEQKRAEDGVGWWDDGISWERERAGSDSRLCALKDINPRCSSNLDVQQPMTKAAQF